MTKKFDLKPTIVLSAICVVIVALLAVVNLFTAPIIEAQKNAAANAALLEVFPNGEGFEEVSLTDYTFPASVEKVWKEKNGGAVVQTNVTGYKAGLIIMCGIDSTGKITGAKYIQSNETLSAEVGLGDRFIGHDKDSITPDLVAGSTAKMTTGAYYKAIEDSLNTFIILGGGSVDMRDPEQILQDNLNAALGTEGKTFTEWFKVAALSGIDKVYVASDNSGRVYAISETLVGVLADGTVATADASAENQAAALAADAIVGGITLEDVTKPTGASKNIVSIQKASNGAYVFEIDADGYQVMFDYGDGTKIRIKLSIDAEGKIVDLITVSHAESAGVGDVCATEDYYEQYRGKGDSDIKVSAKYPTDHHDDLIGGDCTDVGAISSATYTTVGYQKAVKAAFEALALLTGGNEE